MKKRRNYPVKKRLRGYFDFERYGSFTLNFNGQSAAERNKAPCAENCDKHGEHGRVAQHIKHCLRKVNNGADGAALFRTDVGMLRISRKGKDESKRTKH